LTATARTCSRPVGLVGAAWAARAGAVRPRARAAARTRRRGRARAFIEGLRGAKQAAAVQQGVLVRPLDVTRPEGRRRPGGGAALAPFLPPLLRSCRTGV